MLFVASLGDAENVIKSILCVSQNSVASPFEPCQRQPLVSDKKRVPAFDWRALCILSPGSGFLSAVQALIVSLQQVFFLALLETRLALVESNFGADCNTEAFPGTSWQRVPGRSMAAWEPANGQPGRPQH